MTKKEVNSLNYDRFVMDISLKKYERKEKKEKNNSYSSSSVNCGG